MSQEILNEKVEVVPTKKGQRTVHSEITLPWLSFLSPFPSWWEGEGGGLTSVFRRKKTQKGGEEEGREIRFDSELGETRQLHRTNQRNDIFGGGGRE